MCVYVGGGVPLYSSTVPVAECSPLNYKIIAVHYCTLSSEVSWVALTITRSIVHPRKIIIAFNVSLTETW